MTETDEIQDILITDLNTLIKHLKKYNVERWTNYFEKIRKLIDNGDIRGFDSLINIHGGMGSFTDLVICKINGHTIEKK